MRQKTSAILIVAGVAAIALISGFIFSNMRRSPFSDTDSEATPRMPFSDNWQEAMFYQPLSGDQVRCTLCFRQCVIDDGQRGFCQNRENRGGKLYSLVYGRPSALHVDPIEKEPMFHVDPGSLIFCIGTAGCNLSCKFCHNWHLSQKSIEAVGYRDYSPQAIVDAVKERGIPAISFTYNEPTVAYEFMYDIAKLAQAEGIRMIFHTNASMNPEPLRQLLPHIDAVTVDLKGFDESFYQDITGGSLATVLDNLLIIRESGVWLEIVNLVVPTLNDDLETIRQMCRWIGEHLGVDTPVHFNRFTPAHKLTALPATPLETLEDAWQVATDEGLRYVKIGNMPGHAKNSTYCHHCGEIIITRYHFAVHRIDMENGRCRYCATEIPGIWP